ncbi:hypothetical protein PIB30_093657, partial [Stylosanthes scabra]|nr:hypothetical protein [Stylosanthes scabra]
MSLRPRELPCLNQILTVLGVEETLQMKGKKTHVMRLYNVKNRRKRTDCAKKKKLVR